jgi:hypothetical protein
LASFSFPEGTVVGPEQSLVVAGIAPDDARRAPVFRFTLGMDAAAPLVGPYDDPMDDAGGLIQLLRPGLPPDDDPNLTPRIVVDEVNFSVRSPWPESTDGAGNSLTRTRPDDFGPFSTSWIAAAPSPGSVQFIERLIGDANEDGRFDQSDIALVLQNGQYRSGQAARWSDGDWTGDGVFNQKDLVAALQTGNYLENPNAARHTNREVPRT